MKSLLVFTSLSCPSVVFIWLNCMLIYLLCVYSVSVLFFLTLTDDQAAVRVTNLSEDANENDLRELFGPFGPIQRVFLAKDKRTQQSKVWTWL